MHQVKPRTLAVDSLFSQVMQEEIAGEADRSLEARPRIEVIVRSTRDDLPPFEAGRVVVHRGDVFDRGSVGVFAVDQEQWPVAEAPRRILRMEVQHRIDAGEVEATAAETDVIAPFRCCRFAGRSNLRRGRGACFGQRTRSAMLALELFVRREERRTEPENRLYGRR